MVPALFLLQEDEDLVSRFLEKPKARQLNKKGAHIKSLTCLFVMKECKDVLIFQFGMIHHVGCFLMSLNFLKKKMRSQEFLFSRFGGIDRKIWQRNHADCMKNTRNRGVQSDLVRAGRKSPQCFGRLPVKSMGLFGRRKAKSSTEKAKKAWGFWKIRHFQTAIGRENFHGWRWRPGCGFNPPKKRRNS